MRLQWVPSHIGIYGNEEADRLAKLAITVGTKITYFPFYSETLNEFKILCFHKFKEYFDERSKEKDIWYKIIQGQPLQIPWFLNATLSRNYITNVNRLRSGHYPNKKFAFLMKKINSPNCDICDTMDDIEHMFTECEKFKRRVEILMDKYRINRFDTGVFLGILARPTSEVAKDFTNIFIHQ